MPGYRRPVVVVQADSFNASLINTIIVVSMTTNMRLASAPGNLLLTAKQSGLSRNSVVNVSQIITVDKSFLTELVGQLSPKTLTRLEDGLRLVLSL